MDFVTAENNYLDVQFQLTRFRHFITPNRKTHMQLHKQVAGLHAQTHHHDVKKRHGSIAIKSNIQFLN